MTADIITNGILTGTFEPLFNINKNFIGRFGGAGIPFTAKKMLMRQLKSYANQDDNDVIANYVQYIKSKLNLN